MPTVRSPISPQAGPVLFSHVSLTSERSYVLLRIAGVTMDHAHYSLKQVGDTLEGSYHEDGEFGPTNEMVVRVLFDDPSGTVGSFQLAKVKPTKQTDDGTPPEPQPAPEPKSVFDFAFRSQSDGRFHMSSTKWLVGAGGSVQFLAMDDSFVFTKLGCSSSSDGKCSESISSWTATRHGAPRKPAGGDAKGEKRSLFSRWGWYLFAAIGYTGYKAGKEFVEKKTK